MPFYFYFFYYSYNSLKRILTICSFSSQFLKQPDIRDFFFCLVVRGVYPPYTLGGPTPKKHTIFLCVSSLIRLKGFTFLTNQDQRMKKLDKQKYTLETFRKGYRNQLIYLWEKR